ncbi:MAG: PocR ligand-binding domain-containing protein, partial [Methanococcaceae archaeon]
MTIIEKTILVENEAGSVHNRELKFDDLFDLKKIQAIQDAFSDATGVASAITDPNGNPITTPSNFCDLCNAIRSTKKGAFNCQHSDAVIGEMDPSGPKIRRCLSGGLFDGGTSI